MKILCDFCGEGEASVFCCADEAALCSACDRSVHWANKLAGKHRRLSLDGLGSSGVPRHPLCDVCKEKRAFLFCQEDRAILCRDCDEPIHSANHLTMKHSRFLLVGIRVSAGSLPAPEAEEGEKCTDNAIPKNSRTRAMKKDDRAAAAVSAHVTCNASPAAAGGIADPARATLSTTRTTSSATSDGGNSISDYLIKMCPGWHVEDLLVDDATAAAAAAASIEAFSKPQVEELLPFLEADLDGGGLEAICAPHVPQYTPPVPPGGGGAAADGHQRWLGSKEVAISFQQGAKSGRDRWSAAPDDVFTVPQISPAPAVSKRSRHSTWHY